MPLDADSISRAFHFLNVGGDVAQKFEEFVAFGNGLYKFFLGSVVQLLLLLQLR